MKVILKMLHNVKYSSNMTNHFQLLRGQFFHQSKYWHILKLDESPLSESLSLQFQVKVITSQKAWKLICSTWIPEWQWKNYTANFMAAKYNQPKRENCLKLILKFSDVRQTRCKLFCISGDTTKRSPKLLLSLRSQFNFSLFSFTLTGALMGMLLVHERSQFSFFCALFCWQMMVILGCCINVRRCSVQWNIREWLWMMTIDPHRMETVLDKGNYERWKWMKVGGRSCLLLRYYSMNLENMK
jgi:hypothetical protein